MFNENQGLEFCIGKPLKGTEVFVVDDERRPISSSKRKMVYFAIVKCKLTN